MNAVVKREPEDELLDDIAAFFADPLGFVLYAYPWGEAGTPLANEPGPDAWQIEVLEELGRALQRGEDPAKAIGGAIQVAVASGHGIGKTALIAWLIQWFLSTREHPQVVVTASTQTQLSSKTWRELAKWHRMSINRHWFEWTATKFSHVEHRDTWFASAIPWSSHNADAFAGTHEKYVLIIFDEANAIDDVIWETTEGALTTAGAIWIAFGNYTKNTGRFHECFNRFRHRWSIRHQIDSRTCKKANQVQIKQWVDDYGEDSDFVRIRVRGVAPRSGSHQFIGQDLVDKCTRYVAQGFEAAPKILVLDVARFGDDQSVAGVRQGRKLTVLAKWRGLDTVQLTHRFEELIDEIDPDAIVVDGDGIGGPVCDNLRASSYDKNHQGRVILTEFHGAGTANEPTLYYNRRAEVWGAMKDAMKLGCEIPAGDHELHTDLVGPEYTFQKKGEFDVILLEKKEDMKARGLASPDSGDMFAMSFAVKVAVRPRSREKAEVVEIGGSSHASTGWMEV